MPLFGLFIFMTIQEAMTEARKNVENNHTTEPCVIRRLVLEIEQMRKINSNACDEWAEDHTHLQNLCRAAGCTEHEVEGDRYYVPGIMQLADLLRAKLSSPNNSVSHEAGNET